mgnify:CR=1 FL=1
MNVFKAIIRTAPKPLKKIEVRSGKKKLGSWTPELGWTGEVPWKAKVKSKEIKRGVLKISI